LYNLLEEWENREVNFEPLAIFGWDDSVSCSLYGLKNDLINKSGWRQYKCLARDNKEYRQFVNHVKLFCKQQPTIFKYGVQVPSNHNDAMA
jgi:hypothetical protein